MFTTTVKTDWNKVWGKLNLASLARGHQAHKSGAGKHQDRRTNRNRTRSQKNQRALGEW